ncbi:glycosyltransferase family 1 protein [soil metagenome]
MPESALQPAVGFKNVREPPRPRIALFTGAYNHIADGVSLTLNRLVRYLETHRYSVRVFAPTVPEPQLRHAGTLLPAWSIPAPGRPEYRLSLGLSPAARRALTRFDPDLFHIATPDLLGHQALVLARRSNKPVVASYHTHFSSYLSYYGLSGLETPLWWALRRFYSRCDQIYVPTPSMAETLRQHGIREGLQLWPRGVDTERFTPAKRSLAWRRAHGLADDEPVLLFVSRLVWEKGLETLATVRERLQARGVPHRSVVVGDGPAGAKLRARLGDTVFTGRLEGDELATAYASADLFLFPSDTETFGNVVLEAMASGLAAVCANATGSRDLVTPGVTGYLAAPGDSAAFAEATAALLLDPARRDTFATAALTRAQAYDWDAVLARVAGYYEQVLAGQPK